MIVPIIILVLMASALIALSKPAMAARGSQPRVDDATWAAAQAGDNSALGRMLLNVAKPVSNAVDLNPQTAVYRALHTKIAATGGGLYAGSVEVFASVQVAAILIGVAALAVAGITGADRAGLAMAGLFAVVVAAWPYNRVHEVGTKRLEEVREQLPEFAELLLMPVTSGYGIIPALDFTATRQQGVVADEVRTMLGLLSSRAGSEAQIFEQTGQRLAEPAAVTFFNTLYQSYTDGVKVADALRAQAAQLRHQQHQRKRAVLKKLPNKLVFVIALHLLPFLFVVTLLPSLAAMGSM